MMNRLRIVPACLSYAIATLLAWFAIGRWLWSGSDTSQVLVPALMALMVYILGDAGETFLQSLAPSKKATAFEIALLCGLLWAIASLNR